MDTLSLEALTRIREAEKFIKDIERLIAKGQNVKYFVERYETRMRNKYY